MTLHSVCMKYSQAKIDDSPISDAFDDWIKFFGTHHIHIGCFNLLDVFVISEISVRHNGVWELKKSTPRIHQENATKFFLQTKRVLRAQIKMGPYDRHNSCSEVRVRKTFDHLLLNQHVDLYDPMRDGSPNE